MDLHPILRSRFSPLAFDARRELTGDDVDLLLEAARWAPSAGNSQPWGFVVARRGQPAHSRLVHHLAASSKRWAPDASALVVNLVHRRIAGTDLSYSDFAEFDLGQAVAHMTIQAHAMGLSCRQFRAFDLDGLAAELATEDGWSIVSMTAIGTGVGDPAGPRDRRDRSELTEVAAFPDQYWYADRIADQ